MLFAPYIFKTLYAKTLSAYINLLYSKMRCSERRLLARNYAPPREIICAKVIYVSQLHRVIAFGTKYIPSHCAQNIIHFLFFYFLPVAIFMTLYWDGKILIKQIKNFIPKLSQYSPRNKTRNKTCSGMCERFKCLFK